MKRDTTHVRISKRTKKRLHEYIESCNIRMYLGDFVDYAVRAHLNRMAEISKKITGGPPLTDRADHTEKGGDAT